VQRSNAVISYKRLAKDVGDLLDQLHQDDFELLIELVFSSSGWRRISAVGGTQKTLDIALTLPRLGKAVLCKSSRKLIAIHFYSS
jgi:hypothetical protein